MVILVLFGCLACASAEYLDLTHPINDNTLYWFKSTFNLTEAVRQRDPHWVATNRFSTAEHGGTHIDAPYHFNEHGWKLGQVPLRRMFWVKGVMINKTDEVLQNPEYQLTGNDVVEWERENGKIPKGSVVLVNFGWSNRYPDRVRYLGLKNVSDDWDRHFPTISGEAAQRFIDSKVYGVGVDTATPDNKTPVCHINLTKQNIFILENLNMKNLKEIPAKGFHLVILPMKIEQGTGGPVRVIMITGNQPSLQEEDVPCDEDSS